MRGVGVNPANEKAARLAANLTAHAAAMAAKQVRQATDSKGAASRWQMARPWNPAEKAGQRELAL